MAEFSNSGEFGQGSKPSEIVGEKQAFSCQALPNDSIAGECRMDVENDTVFKKNEVTEVELCKNDLGSIDSVVDKPVQLSDVVADGISLERGDVSVNVKHALENDGGDVYVNVQSEQPGDGISLEAMNVSFNIGHDSKNQGVGVCANVLGEQPGEKVSFEGVDVSLNTEPALECQGEDVYVHVQSEQLLDGISSAAADVSLIFERPPENQGEGVNESVQKEQLGDGVSSEGVDVSMNCEHVLANQGEGAKRSVPIEQPKKVISLEGMDISLVSKHASENEGQGAHVSGQGEEPGFEKKADLEAGADKVKGEQTAEIEDDAIRSSHMEGAQISLDELVEKLHSDVTKNCGKIEVKKRDASDIQASPNALVIPSPEKTSEKVRVVVIASPAAGEISRRGRKPKNDKPISTKKNLQQSSVGSSTRSLRSRSKENSKDPEPSADMETAKGNTNRRGRRINKEKDEKSDNEYSKMKKHLRYLLHRINKEQNLLDAYASEGWRGQSLEKLRPEKELQRAKADINRFKLKIRDLFQRLNLMSAEGKFPETLYDSDGLIDSEDIFCAKCGSKDLPIGNDIILCDGFCERGFHQYCLDPPLRTEEIPPGDEGWLCPACDCKLDCIELVNDSQGTKLKIEDSWEKVFPEAIAAATAGKELDDVMGLPSDDSEDNEYNPEETDDDANVEENESNSDKSDSDESDSSDFSSASEDLGAIRQTEQNLGLPSDDSEDDDYDPDAKSADDEEIVNKSSSSDFTSASEDLGAAMGVDDTSDKDEPPLTLEQEQDLGESAPLTSKRCVEKLDYKKLYDETYGNAASDSSEDEDWADTVATRRRKSSAEKAVPVSNLGASVPADDTCGSGTSRRRSRPKTSPQGANGSPAQRQDSSQKTNSGGSRGKRPPYNRLGEAVTQRLYEAFKENQYPDRQAKEKLADELGLTAHRVDKWFGNARWSLHHHPSRVDAIMSRAVPQNNTPQSVACNGADIASNNAAGCSADVTALDATSEKPQKSRKNKKSNQSMVETANTPEAPKGRAQRKRRKPDP